MTPQNGREVSSWTATFIGIQPSRNCPVFPMMNNAPRIQQYCAILLSSLWQDHLIIERGLAAEGWIMARFNLFRVRVQCNAYKRNTR